MSEKFYYEISFIINFQHVLIAGYYQWCQNATIRREMNNHQQNHNYRRTDHP